MAQICRSPLIFTIISIGILFCYANVVVSASNHSQKLLVVLIDGVRNDYMKDSALETFERIAKKGARAEYVVPIFPSNSYPNWQSIVTGLYAENHDFVDNFMYSEEKNETFEGSTTSDSAKPFWWNQTAEPLWITAEKQGIKSAVYWWHGCQVEYEGYKPSACKIYRNFWLWPTVQQDLTAAWYDIMDKFEDGYGLAIVYHEAVDAYGHIFGPQSFQLKEAMKMVDKQLEKLLNLIKSRNMENLVNLVIVSDHGMLDLRNVKNIIDISQAVDLNDLELMLGVGSVVQLRPVKGKVNQVYQKLREANFEGLHVYKKNEIPERYHLKNSDLIQDILLVADKDYFIYKIEDRKKMIPYFEGSTALYKGFHGYDPYETKEMNTIMYASGPAFKKGYISPPLQIVDHYNLFCNVLKINPLPNNGTWPNVKAMLK